MPMLNLTRATHFAIAKKYNSDGEYEYELRRGEMNSQFEEAAYALATGEMSKIVEADGKYYIIRCTSDNDKAKTEVNKSAILADKKLEASMSSLRSMKPASMLSGIAGNGKSSVYRVQRYTELSLKIYSIPLI